VAETLIGHRHERQENLAALESGPQIGASILQQLNFDAGMPPSKTAQKICERILDHLRRSADPQDSSLTFLQRTRSLSEHGGIRQELAAAPEQVFAFRRELDPSPDAVEQRNAQLGLQCMDLSRGGRLTQIEAPGCPVNSTGIHDGDEGTQVAQVHLKSMLFVHRL
jgi:hypothetical protein